MLHDLSLDLHSLLAIGGLGAHCTAHLSHGGTGAELLKALDVPPDFRGPDGKAQAIGGGNCNLAVGPAGADQALVIQGFFQQEGEQSLELGLQDIQGGLDLQACSCVQDVIGCGSQMDPLPEIGALFRQGQDGGHHIVPDLVLDLLGSLRAGGLCCRSDLRRCTGGNHAQLFLRSCQGRLYPKEAAQTEVLFPDGLHLFGSVSKFNGVNGHGGDNGRRG